MPSIDRKDVVVTLAGCALVLTAMGAVVAGGSGARQHDDTLLFAANLTVSFVFFGMAGLNGWYYTSLDTQVVAFCLMGIGFLAITFYAPHIGGSLFSLLTFFV
jgi:hypothetical protein